MATIQTADTLIVSELSRFGRSTAEVIGLVNDLVARRIRTIIIKQGLDIQQNHDLQSNGVCVRPSRVAPTRSKRRVRP